MSVQPKAAGDLLSFYEFPAEHWGHLRTTKPIESTFATLRLPHRRTVLQRRNYAGRIRCLIQIPYTQQLILAPGSTVALLEYRRYLSV
jgi:transposase-like protein